MKYIRKKKIRQFIIEIYVKRVGKTLFKMCLNLLFYHTSIPKQPSLVNTTYNE